MNNWMIMYKIIDGVYEPYQYGSNIVPSSNVDKVIQVPEEIAVQAYKFDFDGNSLKRKEGEYVMTLEELREYERHEELELNGGQNPDQHYEDEMNSINIEF